MSFVKYGNDATFGLREKVKPLEMFRRSAGVRNASNGHVPHGVSQTYAIHDLRALIYHYSTISAWRTVRSIKTKGWL